MLNRLFILAACILAVPAAQSADAPTPEAQLGKRLFFETRFAQAFFAQANGNVNATGISGDPALNETVSAGSNLPGPFAGKTMNCRTCHLEDEQQNAPGGGIRTYADFARRSPIPARGDGKTTTVRNSPALVNASLPRPEFFLHFDGEFPSGADLAQGTFTGRNFGWLASEHATAVKHVANVIRSDDGTGDLALQFGGSYAKVFAGDASVPAQFRLSGKSVLDVKKASDAQVLAAAGQMIAAYLNSLQFSNTSPYDLFLAKNSLPAQPNAGEAPLDYARRLRAAVNALTAPVFVGPADGKFATHAIQFVFGPNELLGLQVFLAEPGSPAPGTQAAPNGPPGAPPPPPGAPPPGAGAGGVGNCIACHAPPAFTDFKFHNTGVSQLEYDAIFGSGAFNQLQIPTLAERKKVSANVLPASAKHPHNAGIFRAIPNAANPGQADLGLWNVYANPDIPAPQKALKTLLTASLGKLKDDAILEKTIASFKTPGLRDLLDSQPYLHNGTLDTIGQTVQFYVQVSQMARANQLRNADPELAKIAFTPQQAQALTQFLNALNEDFQDNN